MVKLKDIAQYVGISVTQVSRALNGYSDVSEDTKDKVIQAAKELGYVKNTAAQRLVTNKSNQLAFIVIGAENDPNDTSSIYTMMKGINDYSLKNSKETIIFMLPSKQRSYTNFLRQRGLEGAILAGLDYDDPSLKELLDSDLACVLIDIPVTGDKKGCILINNAHLTAQAVDALIKSGRKRIAMINGASHSMVSVEREGGYRIAHIRNSLPFDPKLIVDAQWDIDKAYQCTMELLNRNNGIDAFFCSSDFMAIGCLNAVKDAGYRVPEDIGIVGFDGIPQIQYTDPPLSTISQNYYQKGFSAAKLLSQIIWGESPQERSVIVECELTLRSSL